MICVFHTDGSICMKAVLTFFKPISSFTDTEASPVKVFVQVLNNYIVNVFLHKGIDGECYHSLDRKSIQAPIFHVLYLAI